VGSPCDRFSGEKSWKKKSKKKKNHRKYLDVFVPAFSRYAI
jgi:hypothetical protein